MLVDLTIKEFLAETVKPVLARYVSALEKDDTELTV